MRIVALGAEPSIAAALNMNSDWEVVYATEPEQAVQVIAGANVVLIGGGTEEGLRLAESLRTLGVTIPAVVVGDAPTPEGARYPVLTRPFTLDELHSAIDRAVAGARQSPPPQAASAVEETWNTPPESRSKPAEPPSVGEGSEETRGRHLEAARAPLEVPATPVTAPVAAQPSAVPTRVAPAVQAPAPPQAKHHGVPGRGLLRRKPKYTEPHENAVSDRLRAAFDALSAVEAAIEELPVLIDLRDLTQALMGEVVDLLAPQTAALYLPGPDGFLVWSSHGLSNIEKTRAVQSHQPLFADLLVRHESVLIEPLDLAHQLGSGIAGARTNAFLASPIEVNRKCVGVIVAGRDHFENEDLDHLEALAEEAAMGLGVALGLDRLRGSLG